MFKTSSSRAKFVFWFLITFIVTTITWVGVVATGVTHMIGMYAVFAGFFLFVKGVIILTDKTIKWVDNGE